MGKVMNGLINQHCLASPGHEIRHRSYSFREFQGDCHWVRLPVAVAKIGATVAGYIPAAALPCVLLIPALYTSTHASESGLGRVFALPVLDADHKRRMSGATSDGAEAVRHAVASTE